MAVERVDIVITRDKDGNIIYPVTTEDAVILRDGSYLSDKLNTLKVAENMSGKVNEALKEVNQAIEEFDTLSEDALVFDDELATSNLQVRDVTVLIENINKKMEILYRLAIIADEDEEIGLIVEKTILETLAEIQLQIEFLKQTLDNVGSDYTGKEIVYDDDVEYEPDGVLLVGNLSEELIKLNMKINDFKIYCENLTRTLYNDSISKIPNSYDKSETYTKTEIVALINSALSGMESSILYDTFYTKTQVDELLSHKAPLSHSHDNIYVNEGQDVPAQTVKFTDEEYLQTKYDDNNLVNHGYLNNTFISTMENDSMQTSTMSVMEEDTIIESNIESIIPQLDEEEIEVEENVYQHKLTILGDDITTHNRRIKKYYDFIKEKTEVTDIKLVCIRYGTITATDENDQRSIMNSLHKIDNDTDIILVNCGVNDAIYSKPLGKISDKTNETLYGALHNLCVYLIENFTDKLVLFSTPTNTRDNDLTEISEIIKEVCTIYSIPVYDNHSLCGIYPKLNGTVDGTHWNENTHKKVGIRLAKFIDDLDY